MLSRKTAKASIELLVTRLKWGTPAALVALSERHEASGADVLFRSGTGYLFKREDLMIAYAGLNFSRLFSTLVGLT